MQSHQTHMYTPPQQTSQPHTHTHTLKQRGVKKKEAHLALWNAWKFFNVLVQCVFCDGICWDPWGGETILISPFVFSNSFVITFFWYSWCSFGSLRKLSRNDKDISKNKIAFWFQKKNVFFFFFGFFLFPSLSSLSVLCELKVSKKSHELESRLNCQIQRFFFWKVFIFFWKFRNHLEEVFSFANWKNRLLFCFFWWWTHFLHVCLNFSFFLNKPLYWNTLWNENTWTNRKLKEQTIEYEYLVL